MENVRYRYEVHSRNGMWPIDFYRYGPSDLPGGSLVESLIIPRLGKKDAQRVCDELNKALAHGEKLHHPSFP